MQGSMMDVDEVTVSAMPHVMASAFIDIGDTDPEMLMRSLATTPLEPSLDLYRRIIALLLNSRTSSTSANISCTLQVLLRRGVKSRRDVAGAGLKTLGISVSGGDDQPKLDVLVEVLLEALRMGVDLRHPRLSHGDFVYRYYSTFQHGEGPDDDFEDEDAIDLRAGLSQECIDHARKRHFANSVIMLFEYLVEVLKTERGWADAMSTVSSGTSAQFVSRHFIKRALEAYTILCAPPDDTGPLPDHLERLGALGRLIEVCFDRISVQDRPVLLDTVTEYLKSLPQAKSTQKLSVRILDLFLRTLPRSSTFKCEILTSLLAAEYGRPARNAKQRPWKLADVGYYFVSLGPESDREEQELILVLTNLVAAIIDVSHTTPALVNVKLTDKDRQGFAKGVEDYVERHPRYRIILETTLLILSTVPKDEV